MNGIKNENTNHVTYCYGSVQYNNVLGAGEVGPEDFTI